MITMTKKSSKKIARAIRRIARLKTDVRLELERIEKEMLPVLFEQRGRSIHGLAYGIKMKLDAFLDGIIEHGVESVAIDSWPWSLTRHVETRTSRDALDPGTMLEPGTMVLACRFRGTFHEITVFVADARGEIIHVDVDIMCHGVIDRLDVIIDARNVEPS